MSSIIGGGSTLNDNSITGGGYLQSLSVSNLTITNKGIIQKEINEFTDAKEIVSKEYVDASGGNVVGPSNSVDNGVCFFDGTTGKLIKEVSTIKYNPGPNVLAVPDLSTTSTTSLNTDLQKITNITSAVNVPVAITTLAGELDVAKIKSYEHNTEIEFDNTNLLLTADGNINMTGGAINLSGPVVADTIQCPDINTDALNITGCSITNPFNDLYINNGTGFISLEGQLIRASGTIACVAGNGIIMNERAITTQKTTFTDDQELVSKRYVDDSVTLQSAYDNGRGIITGYEAPLDISGLSGIITGKISKCMTRTE